MNKVGWYYPLGFHGEAVLNPGCKPSPTDKRAYSSGRGHFAGVAVGVTYLVVRGVLSVELECDLENNLVFGYLAVCDLSPLFQYLIP